MNAKRILIVEDEQPIREMVVFALANAGYEVQEAADARQAQSCIAERLPDLVLLDWMLPGISGIEIGRRLHHNPETANAVLIAVTGHSLPMYMDDALAVGFRHFLVKPVRLEDLVTTVQSVLAG